MKKPIDQKKLARRSFLRLVTGFSAAASGIFLGLPGKHPQFSKKAQTLEIELHPIVILTLAINQVVRAVILTLVINRRGLTRAIGLRRIAILIPVIALADKPYQL